MEFVYPILIFVIMGIVFGILLVVISKVFAVEEDPRAAEITEALPGANCGGCGYAGCADYAAAIVQNGAPMNACLPGGGEVAAKIGEIMGTTVTAAGRKIPVLHCNGTCTATGKAFAFAGTATCASAKRFYNGTGLCSSGCMGLGDCAAVCPNDVISFPEGIAAFCTENCISCGKCVRACPSGLISLRPETKRMVDVRCASRDAAKIAMKVCQNSCIGCKKCEKVCRFDAIHVVDGHAVLDTDKCKGCGLCAKECPRGCIY